MTINPYSPIASSSMSGINPTTQSLTTGSRINSAADDAAGLAIITALSTQINSQDMATRNANDGISMLQTADGASESIGASLQRMNELSLQAMNGTYSTSQRQMMNEEFQQNLLSISQIAETTNFNGNKLLNGDAASMDIALGSNSTSSLTLPNFSTAGLSIDALNITNPANAALASEGITAALEQLTTARSEFGAQQNGLSSAIENIGSQNMNTMASRSQISDTDFAKASAEQAKQSILNQSAIAMQSQGMQSKAAVLQLLN
ncbi:MAG: flagellin [Thiomicrorhabdus sp.]|nr:MAG: flagellin [Thiomicrorhabdus sp.]